MIIFLYGEDSYRSRQKINEIIDRYRQKHKTGFNLRRIAFNPPAGRGEFDTFKKAVETQSMFDEKKLIIIENILGQKGGFLEEILGYLKRSGIVKDKEVVVVFYESNKADKRGALFKFLVGKDISSQEFQVLDQRRLEGWIEKEVARRGGKIDPGATRKIGEDVGGDLWRLSGEIEKMVSFRQECPIRKEDVSLFIKPKINNNIFDTIEALARRDRKSALRLLCRHLDEGENEIYLLTMFIYQFRNLLVVKDLADQGLSYSEIGKRTKLHPFVVKKSFQQIKNFSADALKAIYRRLAELDMEIKTGKIEPRAALEMVVLEI